MATNACDTCLYSNMIFTGVYLCSNENVDDTLSDGECKGWESKDNITENTDG